MKKRLLNLLLVILLLVAIPGTLILASDISGALYKMSIVVSNNGTLANYVSTNGVILTPNLIAGGFLNSSANNCAVLDKADNDVPFMPGYTTNPWAFWVETIGADSYINYDLYTANTTGGEIVYFPGATGMIVTDNGTLELGDDFDIEIEGWVDTAVSGNKSVVYKPGAFRTYISADNEITSGIALGGDFPVVEAVNGGNHPVNDVNHTVNLPAGIVAGNLLLAFFAADEVCVITFPGGWTELFQLGGGQVMFYGGYRIADGSEGATINVTTSNAQMTAHTTYRITGYSGVPEDGIPLGFGTAFPDPPNLAPTWGARNTLWFASCGYELDLTVNAYPANYTDGRNDRAAHAEGVGCGIARRELNAAAEDPGTFTLSGVANWIANTVAIAPAALEVTAINQASDEYIILTSANTTNLTISIDGAGAGDGYDTVALAGASVIDTGNDWEFFLNNAMPYMWSANVIVAGNISAWEWEYDSVFHDSVGANDATPSFRTASSDANVVATAVSFQPIEEAKAPPWTLDETTATWYTAGNVSGNFTTTPSPTYPGADVIEDIAAASDTPAQLPFVIIFGFITLAISLTISSVLRQYGSRSLLVKVVVIGSLFLVCETLGIVDMWMLVFFLIIALAIMAASKPGEVI